MYASLYGHIAPRTSLGRVHGLNPTLDANTLVYVNGVQQFKPAFAAQVMAKLGERGYTLMPQATATSMGSTSDVAMYMVNPGAPVNMPSLADALKMRKLQDASTASAAIPVLMNVKAAQLMVDPAGTLPDGSSPKADQAMPVVMVPITKAGLTTLSLYTGPGSEYAQLAPLGSGQQAQVSTASSTGGDNSMLLIGGAVVAAITAAVLLGKKEQPSAMHANPRVPTIRVRM